METTSVAAGKMMTMRFIGYKWCGGKNKNIYIYEGHECERLSGPIWFWIRFKRKQNLKENSELIYEPQS